MRNCPTCQNEYDDSVKFCPNDGTPLIEKQTDVENLVGKTIGGYLVLNKLGKGGMGVIYKALQISMDRIVAMKVLLPIYASDREVVMRFHREARAAGNLSHPNIVIVHDHHEFSGTNFLIMEYINGIDVSSLIKKVGAIPFSVSAEIMLSVCKALSYAHQKNVIHRDIKPQNILIDREHATIKVIDFGIAKILDDTKYKSDELTTIGIMIGTPFYMSPEQIMGEALDNRSDLYSVGAVFYEMLTGQVPFDAPTPLMILNKHLHENPKPIRAINQSVPWEIERIVMKALSKSRDERYQSADEMIEDIEASINSCMQNSSLAGDIISLKEYIDQNIEPNIEGSIEEQMSQEEILSDKTPTKKIRETSKKKYMYGFCSISSTPQSADIYIDDKYYSKTPLSRELPAGSHCISLYLSGYKNCKRNITIGEQELIVHTNLEPFNWTMFGGDSLHHRVGNGRQIITPITLWRFDTNGPIYSSPILSDNVVYIGSYDNFFYAINASTKELIWKFKTMHRIASSPCVYKNMVFFGCDDGNLYAIRKDDGKLVYKYKTIHRIISSPQAIDGRLYFGSDDGNLHCIDTEKGNVIWKYRTGDGVWSSPLIYNNAVYVGTNGGEFYSISADTGELKWKYKTNGEIQSSPAIYNEYVYFGSQDKNVYCIDTLTGLLEWKFSTDGWVHSSPAISDGVIYIGSYDCCIYAIDAMTGITVWIYKTNGWIHSSPAILESTVYVGSTDGNLYCIDRKTGALIFIYETRDEIRSSPAIVDGNIYICSNDGSLYKIGG